MVSDEEDDNDYVMNDEIQINFVQEEYDMDEDIEDIELDYDMDEGNVSRGVHSTNQKKNFGYSRNEVTTMEGFGNDSDPQFDLGADGAFSDFSVLIGNFHYHWIDKYCWDIGPGAAFKKKGFKVELVMISSAQAYQQFIDGLNSDSYDAAWLISDHTDPFPTLKQELVKAILSFHQRGRGLLIWADNDPYYVQANYALKALCECELVGNTYGDRVMSYGKHDTPGEFDEESIIFAGISYLYEGITICYPQLVDGTPLKDSESKLKILATSSDGFPCICKIDSTESSGRVIVDTGFTKMYSGYWTSAGQARYVINSAVYLIDVERRFGESVEVDE